MKKILNRATAIACLAWLGMASSASAANIVQFAQEDPSATLVTAVSGGGVTTLSTPSGGIPVFIGFGNLPPTLPGFETFTVGLTSGTNSASQTGTTINQDGYFGTIVLSSLAGGGGTNILTTTFTGGVLSGTAGGNQASLGATQPPFSVSYTSDIPQIQALIGNINNFTLGFSDLSSPLTLNGSVISGFSAANVGTFASSVIPEPSSVVMASISALAGLGGFGWRRFKASRV